MGQRYAIHFTDRRAREVAIEIDNEDWDGEAEELTAGASPLVLQEDDTEGIDTPSRAWTGSLTVVADGEADLSGLFAADVKSAPVRVYIGGELSWQGYIVPDVMKQSWVEGDEVTVSVQSPLAALDGLTLDEAGGFGRVTFGALLAEIAAMTGAWDTVVFPDDISEEAGGDTAGWLDLLVGRFAFFDRGTETYEVSETEEVDVVKYEGMTGREALEEVARLLGWTVRERGTELWFTAESVPGYRRVSVSSLASGTRVVEDVEADGMDIDELDSAGTDHTQSQLQGYRSVSVTYDPDTVDDLLEDSMDSANWTPIEAYDFEEDNECHYIDDDDNLVEAGWYVSQSGRTAPGVAVDPTRAIKYRVSAYKSAGRDGTSAGHLYLCKHVEGGTWRADSGSDYWGSMETEDLTGTAAADELDLERVWGATDADDERAWSRTPVEEEGYDAKAHFGCRRARLMSRNAINDSDSQNDYVEVYNFKEKSTLDGFILWSCIRRQYPIFGNSVGSTVQGEHPVITLRDTRHIVVKGSALLLSINLSGFIGQTNNPYYETTEMWDGMGPLPVTGGGTSGQRSALMDSSLHVRIRVGDLYWTADGWTRKSYEGTVEIPMTHDDGGTYSYVADSENFTDYDKYGLDDGYLMPLVDTNGEDVVLSGDVEFVIYFPYINLTDLNSTENSHKLNFYNPWFFSEISLGVVTPTQEVADFSDELNTGHTYKASTGYASVNDEYSVTPALGTYVGGYAVYTALFGSGGDLLPSVSSRRDGGKTARPERLLLDTLCRLYGRSRRQLSLEVDAARLSPGVVLTDAVEGRTYALTGVSWDVREDKCTYTMEDYIPYTEWNG